VAVEAYRRKRTIQQLYNGLVPVRHARKHCEGDELKQDGAEKSRAGLTWVNWQSFAQASVTAIVLTSSSDKTERICKNDYPICRLQTDRASERDSPQTSLNRGRRPEF
jgi:hypothetical protein